jgi:hypothetical protein
MYTVVDEKITLPSSIYTMVDVNFTWISKQKINGYKMDKYQAWNKITLM